MTDQLKPLSEIIRGECKIARAASKEQWIAAAEEWADEIAALERQLTEAKENNTALDAEAMMWVGKKQELEDQLADKTKWLLDVDMQLADAKRENAAMREAGDAMARLLFEVTGGDSLLAKAWDARTKKSAYCEETLRYVAELREQQRKAVGDSLNSGKSYSTKGG